VIGQRSDRLLLLEQDLEALDLQITSRELSLMGLLLGLQLRAQELDLVEQEIDQGGVILSSRLSTLSTHLSRAVHPVQDDAPAAVGRLEARDSPALEAFAQGRDAQAEDAGSGGQIDAVHPIVHLVQPLSCNRQSWIVTAGAGLFIDILR
jgi:hypothetical protein